MKSEGKPVQSSHRDNIKYNCVVRNTLLMLRMVAVYIILNPTVNSIHSYAIMELPGIRPNSNLWQTLQTKPDKWIKSTSCKQTANRTFAFFEEKQNLFRVGFARHLTMHGQKLEMPSHNPFTSTWLTPERWQTEWYITLYRIANDQPLWIALESVWLCIILNSPVNSVYSYAIN